MSDGLAVVNGRPPLQVVFVEEGGNVLAGEEFGGFGGPEVAHRHGLGTGGSSSL